MKKEDFIIQSEVRRLLVRSNIDYSRIDYGTVKGVVYFRGSFRLAQAMESYEEMKRTMAIKTLLSLERKIRSIPGVVDVVFQLNNWLKEKGKWVPVQSSEAKVQSQRASASGTGSEETNQGASEDDREGPQTV